MYTWSISLLSSLQINSEKEDIYDQDAEEQADGGVSFRVWRKYFGAGGSICMLTFTTFIMIFSQVVVSCNDYFVNFWTQQEEIRLNGGNPLLTTNQCLYIYGALIIGVVVVRTINFRDNFSDEKNFFPQFQPTKRCVCGEVTYFSTYACKRRIHCMTKCLPKCWVQRCDFSTQIHPVEFWTVSHAIWESSMKCYRKR